MSDWNCPISWFRSGIPAGMPPAKNCSKGVPLNGFCPSSGPSPGSLVMLPTVRRADNRQRASVEP